MRINRFIVLFLLTGCFCSYAAVPVSEYVLRYGSIDQRGDSVVLSGKLSIPLNQTPRGILLIPHYTICSAKEAPTAKSVASNNESKPFCKDYILVMPDYIGYGITSDSVPPYLHGALTAQNCVDMYFAAQKFMDSLQTAFPTDTLTIIGFSQGGATALWTLRLIEEQYADHLTVKACFAGSGPYDVAATYDYAVAHNDAGMPATIPLLVMGTSVAYDLDLQQNYFFTPQLSRVYNKSIVPKQKGITSLFFKMLNGRLTHWLTAEGRNKSLPQTQRLYDGLLRSSLIHYPLDNHPVGQQVICPDWRPKAQTYIFHSTTDNVVTFCNAGHLQRCFGDAPNIRYDFGNYGDHLRSLYIFQKRVLKQL